MTPKRVLFLFLSPIQSGLSAIYLAPILTAFEIKDVNRCRHAYTGEKLPNFCAGALQIPKQLKWVLSSNINRDTAQTAQFRAVEILSGTSRHPDDVSFAREFGGVYGLGAISPRKQPISAIGARYFTVQRHSPGVSTLSSSLYCSASPDTLQPACLVHFGLICRCHRSINSDVLSSGFYRQTSLALCHVTDEARFADWLVVGGLL